MKRTMKRALFPLMLALVLLLPACGSGGGNGAPADQTASSTPGAAGGETAEFGGIYEVESPSQSPQESPVYQDPDAKLVRRAELYVETTEFDQAAQQLNEMVNQAGGYFGRELSERERKPVWLLCHPCAGGCLHRLFAGCRGAGLPGQ